MPATEMMKFSGDALDYKRFMRQFRNKVISNTDDMDEIVNYLDQFTTGEANKIVRGYSYMDGNTAYNAILGEFEERYGDTDLIASTYIKRTLEWPLIKIDNVKGLDEFSIFLTECEHAVGSINSLKILEYPENMKRLVIKLAYRYHDKWRNLVQASKDRHQSIRFCDLVDFVRREAKKAVDPIYCKKALSYEQKSSPSLSRYRPGSIQQNKTRTFATNLTDSTQGTRSQDNNTVFRKSDDQRPRSLMTPCICCSSNNHELSSCREWEILSHDRRLHLMMTKGLCFRCFRCGHRGKQCEWKVKWSKCDGNHHTLLHINGHKSQAAIKNVESRPTSACASGPMGAGEVESTMAIIPVRVRTRNTCKTVETCAFLDPGSSVSFCSEQLMDQLGCEGKQMKISLETMGKPHSMLTNLVCGLEVSNYTGGTFIELPRVYSKDEIPVSKDHIPNQGDIEQWEHLIDVMLPQINSEIGLLIGNNMPDAYTPMMVKTGPQGIPHATRTLLGWVVWNVVRSTAESKDIRFPVFRTEVAALEEVESLRNLERVVKQAINFDFPEKMIDDKKEHS
ncbi:uncharacterized protein LOC124273030 [Haliotis rubra]|uniref:uncharacterized protein LOC124273030 n=1 Tax=Haliotis rubra TaxID=36100 RepID=UPI001EE50BEB|nr:uncharacterized protein LOC124273030 [Haliotis rubra]